jgi:RNA polymerase sigma-70 factor (ECF subfamily)
MAETSTSLLDQLRLASAEEAWVRLVDLYGPLIRGWLRKHGLPQQDADDLVQEVLTVVIRKVPAFERQPRAGAFRKWLRTITVNCLRDFWRSRRNRPAATGNSDFQAMLDQLDDPESDLSKVWEAEHNQHVTQKLLEIIRPSFEPRTWEAFRLVTLDGQDANSVAESLGMSTNAVFIAKSRVLSRLRQEGQGLID